MGIQVQNITKNFKDFSALKDVNLHIKSGELVALLGPSGSGKTTLLRIIAGLETADSGTLILDGQDAQQRDVRSRNVGFVFQHYALFKHMTVFDNVAFGLRVRSKEERPSDAEIRRKVMELLALVHLDTFYDRYPSQLSGGQRQRVALARALAVEPKVLLLDEPFGALDAKVRKELRRWMRRLHDDIHITSIFVTHDQEEAMEVSDRVVVMSNGRIEQIGNPGEVYHNPANAFVYDFLGNYNVFDGWKDAEGNVHLAEVDVVETKRTAVSEDKSRGWFGKRSDLGQLVGKLMPAFLLDKAPVLVEAVEKTTKILRPKEAQPVTLYARPHEMYVLKEPDDKEYISARVIHMNPAGPLVKMELERANGALLEIEIPKSVVDMLNIVKGDTLFVRPKEVKVFG